MKNERFVDFGLRMSRQRITDNNRTYSDYQCLMIGPDYCVIAEKNPSPATSTPVSWSAGRPPIEEAGN